jgi:hypothetical protein
VKKAYFELMEWWESTQGSSWIGLADEHFGRIVEPNHLTRCLDLLETFSSHSSPAALAAFLEDPPPRAPRCPLKLGGGCSTSGSSSPTPSGRNGWANSGSPGWSRTVPGV